MRTNKRVGALLRRGEEILLIHRFKNGVEYWVLPGGGVESEETIEEALVREVMEETSLMANEFKLLGEHDREDGGKHIFYEVMAEGEPILGGPEKEMMNENDIYILEWVEKEVAKAMANMYPVEIKEYL